MATPRPESPLRSLYDEISCCKAGSPVVVSWKASKDSSPTYIGHRLPTPTTKANIKATLSMSDISSFQSRSFHVKLRIPLHLEGWGGNKVDVFLDIGGECLRGVETTLYTNMDPADDNSGPGCRECGCKCRFKGPAEGRDNVKIRRRSELPNQVRRAFTYADELEDDVIEVELSLTIKESPRPTIIGPNRDIPVPSTIASSCLYRYMEDLAEATEITVFLEKESVPSVVPLSRLSDSLIFESFFETDNWGNILLGQ
ncbi:hypothetical protein IWX90DRAFT_137181 [Phyllosticta citrichinensis]|uniref:Uncharacterized protein n=1 Tax=Phyllosticta citrichinensis TaxID=1130410 RepID=A0ABR1XY77_9PEZI